MMIRSVEKAVTKNTEDRIKYPDDPLKYSSSSSLSIPRFEESECELHKQLKKSSTFSTTPHLYPLLVLTIFFFLYCIVGQIGIHSNIE